MIDRYMVQKFVEMDPEGSNSLRVLHCNVSVSQLDESFGDALAI